MRVFATSKTDSWQFRCSSRSSPGAAPSNLLRAAQPKSASSPQIKDSVYEMTQDKGYRFDRGGWIYVHLEGAPHDIGYQHGYLLAPEIADAFVVSTGSDAQFRPRLGILPPRRARNAVAQDRSRISGRAAGNCGWPAAAKAKARSRRHRRAERISGAARLLRAVARMRRRKRSNRPPQERLLDTAARSLRTGAGRRTIRS